MTVSAGTKAFENLKLENCRERQQWVHPKKIKKMPGIYQNLDINIT